MKVNRFGQGEILNPEEISLLFHDGFINLRDRALFGICLYAKARINEACTMLKRDVISPRGVHPIIIRIYNTKDGRDTWEIQIHPILKAYLEVYTPTINARRKNPHLFLGRHGLNHIHASSADDRILREALQRVGLEEGGFIEKLRLHR